MANIPMKDIQFPGLDDTYTFAQVDATLTTQGKAADAKKTGDEISELKADLSETNERYDDLNSAVQDIGVFENGVYADGAVLFDINSVKPGDTLYYSFDALTGSSGFIDILDTSGSRITYIGKGSTSVSENHYEGTYAIPENFGKAVAIARISSTNLKSITVNYVITNPTIHNIKTNIDKLNAEIQNCFVLEPTGDTTDRSAEINSALQSEGIVRLGVGDFYIESSITIPNGATLIGQGDNTVIHCVSGISSCAIEMTNESTVSDMKIIGLLNAMPSSFGNLHGVKITTTNSHNRVENISLSGFSGACVYSIATYVNKHNSNTINNCRCTLSGCGVYVGARSEAFNVSDCEIQNCYIGVHCIGGNNIVSACIIRSCTYGVDMTSVSSSDNDGHSVFSSLVIIHNDHAIKIDTIENGSVFIGCSIFYGDIVIANAKNIIFSGSNFGSLDEITATDSTVRITDSVFQNMRMSALSGVEVENVPEITDNAHRQGIAQKGVYNDGDILFAFPEVKPGDVLRYDFDAQTGYTGFIDILGTNGSRIAYIGKGSTSSTQTNYTGEYTIPENFEKAVVVARAGSSNLSYITVNYTITNNLIYTLYDHFTQISTDDYRRNVYDYKCTTQNRLANPIYETFETINQEETVISREIPMNAISESVGGIYRIPTCIITNAGTILIAAERRANGNGADKGKISIDLVRKTENGNWGTVTTVLPYNETYGRYMNPCFVIDRTGVHGTAGRIYLFAGTFLNDDVTWTYNTYEECNMIYIYSDDDGVTWSNQISLKSAWDETEISVLSAPTNGIQLTNGTLVIPVFGYDGTRHNNALFYKTPNDNWKMSAKNELVSYNINENTIVEYETNKVKIYCNNSAPFPRVQYPYQFDRYCTPTFTYDLTTDTFAQIQSTFDRNLICQFSVQKVGDIYLMSFPDVNNNYRANITVWASNDGEKWIRCFMAYMQDSNGYSVITEYDDKIVMAFEDHNGNISFENLTPIADLFNDSCEKYIDNVSVQDRMQLMH